MIRTLRAIWVITFIVVALYMLTLNNGTLAIILALLSAVPIIGSLKDIFK